MIALDEPMPKNCRECMLLVDFIECRPLRKVIHDYTTKPKNCPLREIHTHGVNHGKETFEQE